MGDMICKRCGEPWEAYEVRHEFTKREKIDFYNGTQCPTCKNTPDRDIEYVPNDFEVMASRTESSDEDPIKLIDLLYS